VIVSWSAVLVLAATLAVTSAVAYLVGRRALGLPRGVLGVAVSRSLECIGLTVVFAILNTAAGILIVLASRGLTGRFVALYVVSDVVLLPLSLVQGLVFRWWLACSADDSR
jgi:hypothetical protein